MLLGKTAYLQVSVSQMKHVPSLREVTEEHQSISLPVRCQFGMEEINDFALSGKMSDYLIEVEMLSILQPYFKGIFGNWSQILKTYTNEQVATCHDLRVPFWFHDLGGALDPCLQHT